MGNEEAKIKLVNVVILNLLDLDGKNSEQLLRNLNSQYIGTGKTCSIINLCEKYRQSKKDIFNKNILI